MDQNFEAALHAWIFGAENICNTYRAKHYPSLEPETLSYTVGKRYIRIVISGRSVHAFIDKTNGDVLKPAGFKAPAKHARGNIFDEKGGLGCMGPYGPAYLR